MTTFLADELDPTPVGELLIYVSNQGGNRDIWSRPLAGGEPRRLTWHSADDYDPAVDPSGEWIVFVSQRHDAKGDLMRMRVRGGDAQRLTRRDSADRQPAWFPDGKRIAYARSIGNGPQSIHVLDLESGRSSALSKRQGFAPAVSPDGELLVFSSMTELEGEQRPCLWLHRLADGEEAPVHACEGPEGFATWTRWRGDLHLVYSRFMDDTNDDGRVDLRDRPSLWRQVVTGWGERGLQAGQAVPLTSGHSSDITPRVMNGEVFYASRRDEDLDIWVLPMEGALPELQSEAQARSLVSQAPDSQTAMFVLRRCAAELKEAAARERCALRLASHLFEAGRPAQAGKAFERIERESVSEASRTRARLGRVATDMSLRLPEGLTPSQQRERASLAEALLRRLDSAMEGAQGRAALLRADVMRRVGRWDEALGVLAELLETGKAHERSLARARLLRGRIRRLLGQNQAALESYLEVLRLHRDRPEERIDAAGRILALARTDPALGGGGADPVEQLESLAKRYGDLPVLPALLRVELGRLHREAGRLEMARQAYARVESHHGGEVEMSARALAELADLAEESGDLAQALDHAQELLQRHGARSEWQRLARALIRRLAARLAEDLTIRGETGMAIKVLNQLLAQEPNDLLAHRRRIDLLAARGQALGAVEEYRRLVESRPGDDVALYLFGLSLTYLGDSHLEEALSQVDKALRLNSQMAFAHQTRGWIWEQLARRGDRETGLQKAAEAYQAALSLLDVRAHPRAEADLLLNLGNVSYALGDQRKAHFYYKRRHATEIPFLSPERRLVFFEQFGRSAFLADEQVDSAYAFSAAQAMARELKRFGHLGRLVAAQAAAEQMLGQHQKAADSFARACELWREQGQLKSLPACYRNVGFNLFELGKLEEAAEAFSRAAEMLDRSKSHGENGAPAVSIGLGGKASRAAFGFDRLGEWNFLHTYRSRLYREAGDLSRARLALRRKMRLLQSGIETHPHPDLELDLAIASNHLAMLELELGRPERADQLFAQSAELARKLNSAAGVLSNALNRLELILAGELGGVALSDILAELRQLSEPAGLEAMALSRRQEVRLFNGLGLAHLKLSDAPRLEPQGSIEQRVVGVLSDLDRRLDHLQRASVALDRAVEAARDLSGRAGLRMRLLAEWNLAEAWRLQGRAEEARDLRERLRRETETWLLHDLRWRFSEQGLSILMNLPPGLARSGLEHGRARERDEVFEAAISAAAAQGAKDRAWELSEQWNARRSLDGLRIEDLRVASDEDRQYLSGLKIREQALENSLDLLQPGLEGKDLSAARDKALADLDEFLRFRNEGGQPRALLRDLMRGRSLRLSELQALLEPSESLVQVVALPAQVLIFLICREEIKMRKLELSTEAFKTQVAELRSERASVSAAARMRLSRWVLEPWAAELEAASSMLAVTDQVGLPLGWLLLDGRSLITQKALSHLNRAADLSWHRGQRNLHLQRALWVGEAPSAEVVTALKALGGSYRTLPGLGLEQEQALGESGIFAFAGDVLIDPVRPLRSSLSTDRLRGSLGALTFGSLPGKPVESALWISAGSDGPMDEAAGQAWAVGLAGAGVPSLLSVPNVNKRSERGLVLAQFLSQAERERPAESLSRALREGPASTPGFNWRLWLDVHLRGDPGMDRAQRQAYAQKRLKVAVGQAMGAYKAKRWSVALSAFLQVHRLAAFLGQDAILPQVDAAIVQSAFALGEIDLALKVERRVLARAEKAEDLPGRARAHNLLGVLHSRAGQVEQAVELLSQAVGELDKLKLAAEAAEAQANLVVALDAGARYPESLRAAGGALARFEALGDSTRVIRLQRTIGATYLKRLNMASTAREWFKKALQGALAAKSDELATAIMLELARTELAAGRYEDGLGLADEARLKAEQAKLPRMMAEALLERAKALWYLGEYQRAFMAQRKALRQAEASADSTMGIMARSLGGLIALNLGDLSAAERELEMALDAARKAGLRSEEAAQLNNLGIVARQRGDLEKARKHFQQALRIDVALKSGLGRAYDLRNLGVVARMQGLSEQAGEFLAEALELSQSAEDRFNEVKTRIAIARLALDEKDLERARVQAESALELADRLGLREVSWRALRILGQVDWRRGDLERAHAQYSRAIEIVERMRSGLRMEAFRSGFLDNKYDLYEDMLHLLFDMSRAEEAFVYAERSRARGFLDLLANRSLVIGGGGDPELLKELRRLRERLVTENERLRRSGEQDQGSRQEIEEAIAQTSRDYESLLSRIRSVHPELTDFVEVRPLDPQEIQRQLPGDVALLAYYVTEQDTMLWVLRRDSLSGHRVALSRDDLREQVDRLRRNLEQFAPLDKDLAQLDTRLIAPVAKELQGVRALGLIPHDALHYLPFSALLDQDGRYLVDRFELFSAPSVSVMAQLRQRMQHQLGPFGAALVLGNPDRGDASLALPFAEREAQSIGYEQPGGLVMVGVEAGEHLLHEAAGTAEYLHLACHGTFQPASPLLSALLLADGKGHDGDLTAIEVFSIPLTARLVTLSACQTGLGSLERGDELVGFNRAFLAAGAGGVLSSLWRVSDVATAVLMKRFYRNLRAESIPEALRNAQRLVRRYHPHPAYWAGFVLTRSW